MLTECTGGGGRDEQVSDQITLGTRQVSQRISREFFTFSTFEPCNHARNGKREQMSEVKTKSSTYEAFNLINVCKILYLCFPPKI